MTKVISVSDPIGLFISHDHDDKKLVDCLENLIYNLFGKKLFDIFLSSNKILAGDDWRSKIIQKLLGSKIVIVIFTPRSLRSSWVSHESGAGWILEQKSKLDSNEMSQKRVFMPCYVGTPFEELPDTVKANQVINLNERDEVEKLAKTLDTYVDHKPSDSALSNHINIFVKQVNDLTLSSSGQERLEDNQESAKDSLGMFLVGYADSTASRDFLKFCKILKDRNFIQRESYSRILEKARGK